MKVFTAFFTLAYIAVRATASCTRMGYMHLTFYGYPDNNPPSADTAYSCGGRNNIAGGTGTYVDPVTFASAEGEFNECETVYIPYLEKYARCKLQILINNQKIWSRLGLLVKVITRGV